VKLGTSAGYSDYFVSKPVPFPTIPEKEKPAQVRVFKADYEEIVRLQDFWKLPNQQSVVSRLIERQEKNVELGRQLQEKSNQLQELRERINQLEKEKAEMSQVQAQPQQITVTPSELEAMIERMVSEKVEQALASLPVTQQASQTNESKPTTQAPVKPQEVIDWVGMSNADLWATKVKGASEEKIRRSYEAIALYNDTIATGDNDRLAITNQALRELSGVNGLLVGDWIKAHASEVITHNSKYGMQNSKDLSKVETYYNKRHGQEKITKILSLVNEQFLDGEALKSQQK
jgi:hypothetical protein